MAGIFQRLFKTGQAEAHAIVDKLEDPIKLSEQAIRDLKKDLQESWVIKNEKIFCGMSHKLIMFMIHYQKI